MRRERHNIINIAAYLETAVTYQIINYIKAVISETAKAVVGTLRP